MLQKKMLKTYLGLFNKRGDGHLLLWLFGTIIIVVILLIFLVAAGVVSLAGISLFGSVPIVSDESQSSLQSFFALLKTKSNGVEIKELILQERFDEAKAPVTNVFNFISVFFPEGYNLHLKVETGDLDGLRFDIQMGTTPVLLIDYWLEFKAKNSGETLKTGFALNPNS